MEEVVENCLSCRSVLWTIATNRAKQSKAIKEETYATEWTSVWRNCLTRMYSTQSYMKRSLYDSISIHHRRLHSQNYIVQLTAHCFFFFLTDISHHIWNSRLFVSLLTYRQFVTGFFVCVIFNVNQCFLSFDEILRVVGLTILIYIEILDHNGTKYDRRSFAGLFTNYVVFYLRLEVLRPQIPLKSSWYILMVASTRLRN